MAAWRWLTVHAHSLAWNGVALIALGLAFVELAGREDPRQWVTFSLLGAVALCGLIGNAHRFEVFKAFGIEARTWRVVEEAETAIAALQDVAVELGKVAVEAIAAAGKDVPLGSPAERDAKKTAMVETLRRIGVREDRLRDVERSDRAWALADYRTGVECALQRAAGTENRSGDEASRAINRLYRRYGVPSPSQMRHAAKALGPLPAEVQELLLDLEHYDERGEHRRPDSWARRKEWLRHPLDDAMRADS